MLLTACAWMAHARSASAASFDLQWSAPSGCPSRERMLAATRARLGAEEEAGPPELFARGSVTVDGTVIVVDLQIKDARGRDRGERRLRFDDRTCEAIELPTALVLAMMLGVAPPAEADGTNETSPSTLPAAPGSTVPNAPVLGAARQRLPRSPEAAVPRRRRPPMSVGLSAVASRGVLPNIGFGVALRWLTNIWGPVVLGVEGSFETTWAVPAGNGEATFRQFDGAVLIGTRILRSRWLEIVPLLEGRGGVLAGDVTGLPSTYDATSAIACVGAGVLGRVTLDRALRLEVLPDVRVPFVRDEFQVRRNEELLHIHRPAAVEGRLSIGLAWDF